MTSNSNHRVKDDNVLQGRLERLAHSTSDKETFCAQAVQLIAGSNDKYDWVGIYLSEDDTLHLPESYFVGANPDHKVIPFDEGICGAAATSRKTVVVDDVKSDPRYLACSIFTQSEIVVPIIAGDTLYGVLDLDSDTPAAFQSAEQSSLEAAAGVIAAFFQNQT